MKSGFLISNDPKISLLTEKPKESDKTIGIRKYKYEDFDFERNIGTGNFSNVWYVTLKSNPTISYAIKIYNISNVYNKNYVDFVKQERNSLICLNTPGHKNVIQLIDTFKDNTNLYLIYEYGIELWDLIKFSGSITDEFACWLIHQIIDGLEYIHSKNIIHRDLKCENIIISQNNLKIIDFATSKFSNTTNTHTKVTTGTGVTSGTVVPNTTGNTNSSTTKGDNTNNTNTTTKEKNPNEISAVTNTEEKNSNTTNTNTTTNTTKDTKDSTNSITEEKNSTKVAAVTNFEEKNFNEIALVTNFGKSTNNSNTKDTMGNEDTNSVSTTGVNGNDRKRIMRFENYVGTPNFMDPRTISNMDNGYKRDIWSLGCIIYQIMVGRPPFYGSTEYFIIDRVKKFDLIFPEMNPQAKDLILLLLNQNISLDLNEIRNHPFLKIQQHNCLNDWKPLREICYKIGNLISKLENKEIPFDDFNKKFSSYITQLKNLNIHTSSPVTVTGPTETTGTTSNMSTKGTNSTTNNNTTNNTANTNNTTNKDTNTNTNKDTNSTPTKGANSTYGPTVIKGPLGTRFESYSSNPTTTNSTKDSEDTKVDSGVSGVSTGVNSGTKDNMGTKDIGTVVLDTVTQKIPNKVAVTNFSSGNDTMGSNTNLNMDKNILERIINLMYWFVEQTRNEMIRETNEANKYLS